MTSGGVRIGAAAYLTRIFICFLGLAAVAWGGLTLPRFWQQAPLRSVASKLLAGHTFKMQWLLDEARQTEATGGYPSFCNPTALHDLVLLRLAIYNESLACKQPGAGRSRPTARYMHLIPKGAFLRAADPFAWLTLFWLDAGKQGLKPDNVNYLRLSYVLGPNEAWIAQWRNRLAFARFERLPTDLSDDAIDEFIKLLDTGQLYWQTAAIFASAPAAAQSRIVEHLNTANAISREAFARVLHDKGLDVIIPGVERPEPRPWR